MAPQYANSKKLLVLVEPNTEIQLSLLKALRDLGCHNPLLIFDSSAEVLEHFFSETTDRGRRIPGLLLLACQKTSCFDVLRRFKTNQRLQQVPILVFTDQPAGLFPALETYREGAASLISTTQTLRPFNVIAEIVVEYWLKTCRLPGD